MLIFKKVPWAMFPFMAADTGGGDGVNDSDSTDPSEDDNSDDGNWDDIDEEDDFTFDDFDDDNEGDDDTSESEDDSEEDETEDANDEGQKQSDDENAKYAAARRKAESERDAIARNAEEVAKKNGFSSFAEMENVTNTTAQVWRRDEIIAEYARDPAAAIQKLVELSLESSPMMQDIEKVKQDAAMKEATEFASRSFDNLRKKHPDSEYKSIDDMYATNEGKEILYLWTKGVDMTKAYELANIDKISSKKAAAAKQKTLNQYNGKSHMKSTKNSAGAGDDTTNVPNETLKIYRDLHPDWTRKQAVDHYRRVHTE